jgi:GxxExxY protein
MNLIHEEITDKLIKAFYNVYNELGYGFLEKVYEKAMIIEFKNLGVATESQFPIEVFYKGEVVGSYFADIVAEYKVIVELKAKETITAQHEVQLINYLKATDAEVGLLFNFGTKPEFRRKALSNINKKSKVKYYPT